LIDHHGLNEHMDAERRTISSFVQSIPSSRRLWPDFAVAAAGSQKAADAHVE